MNGFSNTLSCSVSYLVSYNDKNSKNREAAHEKAETLPAQQLLLLLCLFFFQNLSVPVCRRQSPVLLPAQLLQ